MSFEDQLETIYRCLIRSGDFVIDIGAHSGRHTIPMAECVGATGMVLAFEPNPTPRKWLKTNILMHSHRGRSKVLPYALSNSEGKVDFVVAVDRPEESGLRVRQYNGPTRLKKIRVKVRTLDSLLDKSDRKPSFIKIDVEGAEWHCLLGSRKTLEIGNPILAFEFGAASYSSYGVNPSEVFQYLQTLGYNIYSITGKKLNQETFVEASIKQEYWDYLACCSDDVKSLETALSICQVKSDMN